MSKQLQDRAIAAATRSIEMKGYEVLATRWASPSGIQADIIAYDREALVFIDVTVCDKSSGSVPEGHATRGQMELLAIDYLIDHEPADGTEVRFDTIDLMVFGQSRALLKHHVGAYSIDD